MGVVFDCLLGCDGVGAWCGLWGGEDGSEA